MPAPPMTKPASARGSHPVVLIRRPATISMTAPHSISTESGTAAACIGDMP